MNIEITSTAKFLAKNIINNQVSYEEVVAKRPDLKEQIDAYLQEINKVEIINKGL